MDNPSPDFNDLVIDVDNFTLHQQQQSGDNNMGIARFDRRQRPSPSLDNLFSNRDVLARRLKNRPDKNDLVDRNIIPAHVSNPNIYDKIAQLERKKTGDFLQRKIRARPNRQQLIQRHILSDHRVDPSLFDSLGRLERQKIADQLSERLLSRPGPIELIQDHILPVESPIQNAIEQGQVAFESTVSPTSSNADSSLVNGIGTGVTTFHCGSPSPPPSTESFAESFKNHLNYISKDNGSTTRSFIKKTPSEPNIGNLTISISQKENEKLVRAVNKKSRPAKPRVKKLKFHECRPPDMPSDSPSVDEVDERYQRLLEQQTLYLRLQVMQQNAMMNALQGNTNSMEAVTEEIENVINQDATKSAAEVQKSLEGKKLDDLRVRDLRAQLKQRGLLVSGSKARLIERLIAYEEGNSNPADFSYGGVNSVAETMQNITSPKTSSSISHSTPATTVMQVTTYTTDATGKTYQVIQAVPQSPHNVMQYQVLPANYVSNAERSLSPLQMEQVNIQPVVAVTQPHVMTLQESVSGLKTMESQASPSQIQFHLTPPPQQPSPTIVLHQGPPVQRAALLQHEKHKVQVQHMPGLNQNFFMANQSQTAFTQLSQSLPATHFNANYFVQNHLTNKKTEHKKITTKASLDTQLRIRTVSEPAQHYKRSQSYGDHKGLMNGLDKNANYPQPLVSTSSLESISISGTQPSTGMISFEQNQGSGIKTETKNDYDDIMDIIGELSTPSPINMASPIPSSAGYVKTDVTPQYNSCLYYTTEFKKQVTNNFLNIGQQRNKQFSSVPENINTLSNSPSQAYLSSPYGSLGTHNNLSGSMTDLQSPQSGSYGNLNLSSSTGNLLSDNFQNSLSSPFQTTQTHNYLKMSDNPMSPMSTEDESLAMELEGFPASNNQNNDLNWSDLSGPDSPANMQFQGMPLKDNSSAYSSLAGSSEILDINTNNMLQQHTLFGHNERTQTSIYSSSPRPQDGYVSLFDLQGGDY